MKNIRSFRDRLKRDLKDPEFRKAFDEEEVYASLAIQIEKLRERACLTQKELAEKLSTTQQTVSRLESVNNTRYTIHTLVNIAKAFHKKLEVRLKSKFKLNPFAPAGSLWFPHRCLGSECAKWAVNVSREFIKDFCDRMGVPLRIDIAT